MTERGDRPERPDESSREGRRRDANDDDERDRPQPVPPFEGNDSLAESGGWLAGDDDEPHA